MEMDLKVSNVIQRRILTPISNKMNLVSDTIYEHLHFC